jgi:hypothetical protein
VTAWVERAVQPLDVVRTALYRFAFRIPRVGKLVTRRDGRVALVATGHALSAFVLTVLVPSLLIAVGPILLGVAHVAADVRYLVLRRGLPRWWLAVIAVACTGLFAIRLAQELGLAPVTVARIEYAIVSLWLLGAVGAGALGSGRWRRALGVLPVLGALAWVAQAHPYPVRIAFTHVHNLVAITLWLALFRGRLRAALVPLVCIASATALLLSGQTFAITESLGATRAFGLDITAAADWLAPGLPFRAAIGLTLSFAFLQSVHYSMLLLCIPQEDVHGQGTPTFRQAARSLGREFGSVGFAALILGAFVVVAGAFFGIARARNLYLSLAMFHGYLELALGSYFFVRGGFGAQSAPALAPASASPLVASWQQRNPTS